MPTLVFYDVFNAATADTLNLGTVAAGSSDDTQLRVYNSSSLYTATDVTVSLGGDNPTQLYLSLDGDTFTTTVDVGDILPSSYSPPFTLRRVTHRKVQSQAYSAALLAAPASWSNTDAATASDNIPLETEE